mmetsp:Transcript_18532/g.70111  ORF Transcript_18532/g.70111 Transcript_18532/m.70111 type:complete len:249 (+) Transcript_18532:1530-2276(+)
MKRTVNGRTEAGWASFCLENRLHRVEGVYQKCVGRPCERPRCPNFKLLLQHGLALRFPPKDLPRQFVRGEVRQVADRFLGEQRGEAAVEPANPFLSQDLHRNGNRTAGSDARPVGLHSRPDQVDRAVHHRLRDASPQGRAQEGNPQWLRAVRREDRPQLAIDAKKHGSADGSTEHSRAGSAVQCHRSPIPQNAAQGRPNAQRGLGLQQGCVLHVHLQHLHRRGRQRLDGAREHPGHEHLGAAERRPAP